jgi:hypothetical protein
MYQAVLSSHHSLVMDMESVCMGIATSNWKELTSVWLKVFTKSL